MSVQGEGHRPQKRSVTALSPFLLRTAKARYELQGQHPRGVSWREGWDQVKRLLSFSRKLCVDRKEAFGS